MLELLDSRSKVNAIYPTFAKELDLFIKLTDVGVQKIDGTTLDIYEIVVVAFLMTEKANQVKFFEKTFFVANVSPKVVFVMLFLTLSGAILISWIKSLDREFIPIKRPFQLPNALN